MLRVVAIDVTDARQAADVADGRDDQATPADLLHLLVTDGGFRPDGTFVSWPVHDNARLTEAFRRGVLRFFVRLELFDEDQTAGMLTWPHSGFHLHSAVWVPDSDRAFATRLVRYCARNPVALERLTYDRSAKTVTYRSDKSEGPTTGTETVDPLEFLARVLVHIPDRPVSTARNAPRPRGDVPRAPRSPTVASPRVPPLPGHPDASPPDRPTWCASPAEGTPTPTRRSRGKRPRPIRNVPRLNFRSLSKQNGASQRSGRHPLERSRTLTP